MTYFIEKQGKLFAEQIPISRLAKQWGTPLYIYSRAALTNHFLAFQDAFSTRSHTICYAVKANSNIAVLKVLAQLGAGFDIVSKGELMRVLAAGGVPEKVVFSGIGKLAEEIEYALHVGIGCFNIESHSELICINQIAAKMNKIAPIAIRVNPNIDANTHPYISTGLKENKFGIDIQEAVATYQKAMQLSHIKVIGLGSHIGSQLLTLAPFIASIKLLYALYQDLKSLGIVIQHLDLGGGLGVRYTTENPPTPADYSAALLPHIPDKNLAILIEPGRSIAANAGILVTRVIYLKQTAYKNFAIVDAAMNDLLRPALYQAEQDIVPLSPRFDVKKQLYDVVGPVCETSDFLGKNRLLALLPGDLLAITSAGAYGFSMSSNYNSRPRAAEIMVDHTQHYLIRTRESLDSLFSGEQLLPS